jgi:hypothetical protein
MAAVSASTASADTGREPAKAASVHATIAAFFIKLTGFPRDRIGLQRYRVEHAKTKKEDCARSA